MESESATAPQTVLKALFELDKRECHHPVTENPAIIGRWLFCARPVVWGTSYCIDHQSNHTHGWAAARAARAQRW